MKRICIYCGSRTGSNPIFSESARLLARECVGRGYSLVYGGGNVGLMGVVAREFLQAGSEVIGVIPDILMEKELGLEDVTDLKVVGSMHERKQTMADLAEGFIALPGGIGTLEELFEIITWGYLGLHAKPCGLLNAGGYFDHLGAFLDRVAQDGFLHQPLEHFLVTDSDPAQLISKMEGMPEPGVEVIIEKESQT